MTAVLRRRLLVAGLVVLAGLAALALARSALAGAAFGALLRMAGASQVRFSVAEAWPWRVVVEDLGFHFRTQEFAAGRVVLARGRWWAPSLGRLEVERARLAVNVDGSDRNPWSWATYRNGTVSAGTLHVPLEEISLDGRLVVQAASLPEQELAVTFAARLAGPARWEGRVAAEGAGLALRAEGGYDLAGGALDFRVPAAELDLAAWSGFVQRLVVLPGGPWELQGRLAARGEGRLADGNLKATGRVELREGRIRQAGRDLTAEGVEADLEFTDVEGLVTRPGALRARELRAGQLVLRALDAEVALAGPEKVLVSRLTLEALGGRVTAEPFRYFPALRELEGAVVVEGLRIEDVLALTPELPARATGRVDGRVPLRIDDSGVRLGTGWLALTPGVQAEVRFNATGLLTRGAAPGSAAYAVLQKVESGLLGLRITELRLDLRPPGAPVGRTAQLHLAGEPADPGVKAPVRLDLNVNGPVERLINLGLDSRLKFRP